MSMEARHRWVVWSVVGLVAAGGIGVGIDRAFLSGQTRYSWPPEPCVVQGLDARCGTFVVPEDRSKPNGRTIGSMWSFCLRSRSLSERTRSPISPATGRRRHRKGGSLAFAVGHAEQVPRHPARRPARDRAVDPARRRRDGVRDADGDGRPGRGAGGARLPAVRRDRELLRSHGGTGLRKLHPCWCAGASSWPELRSGRLFDRFAFNAQRALDQLARLRSLQPDCRKAFPDWNAGSASS